VNKVWVKKSTTKRLFIAIPLPKRWQQVLTLYQHDAKSERITGTVPTRWTDRGNLHITIRFIGSINESCIPKLIQTLRGFVGSIHPFVLPFQYFEFATPKEPKMIWARFANTEEFHALVRTCTKILAQFLHDDCGGMKLHNGHHVIPHVTVARLKGDADRAGKLSSPVNVPEDLAVTSLVLNESKTLPNGSVYRTLATFHLPSRKR
jgi:2'-5' RNA ligase